MVGDHKQHRLLLFPIPFQGHLSPMLHLATILHSKGFSITIIQTHHNSPNPTDFPHFTFHFIDDGLPENSTAPTPEALNKSCSEPFKDCLSRVLSSEEDRRPGCLIADPMWDFVGALAVEFNLPRLVLRTGSISAFVVYESLPLLQQKCYFPLQETRLDEPVLELPPLKVKDLPKEPLHALLATLVKEIKTSQGIICNTFEELETSSLASVQNTLSIPVFSIGPLHKHSEATTSKISLSTQEQTSIIAWLNSQEPKSVLYVSFGTIANMNEAEFEEIAWGLANSMQRFLWVVRPGLVQGSEPIDPLLPEGYLEAVRERGHIVKWAPQLEVLAHPAIGGFWTHCGWNSTIEGVSEGVPMICMPFFADQGITARHVSENWRIGLQLEKEEIRRNEIKRVVRRLMVDQEGEEMRERAAILKEVAMSSLMEDGSSYKSLESLTSYLMSL